MAKFCNNCGAQLEDDAVFCASCGTAQEAAPEAAPAADFAPQYEAPAAPEAPAAKKNFLPVIIGGVAAVVVVVLLIVLLGGSGGYKKAIKYQQQFANGNYKNYEKVLPQEVWDKVEESNSKFDIDDVIDEEEKSFEDGEERREDTYGDNYKVTYKVKDSFKLPKEAVEDIAKKLDKAYEIDEKDVKSIVSVSYLVTKKGSDFTNKSYGSCDYIKIKNKWYPFVAYYDSEAEEYTGSFYFD